jgi:hypothetical protein
MLDLLASTSQATIAPGSTCCGFTSDRTKDCAQNSSKLFDIALKFSFCRLINVEGIYQLRHGYSQHLHPRARGTIPSDVSNVRL